MYQRNSFENFTTRHHISIYFIRLSKTSQKLIKTKWSNLIHYKMLIVKHLSGIVCFMVIIINNNFLLRLQLYCTWYTYVHSKLIYYKFMCTRFILALLQVFTKVYSFSTIIYDGMYSCKLLRFHNHGFILYSIQNI